MKANYKNALLITITLSAFWLKNTNAQQYQPISNINSAWPSLNAEWYYEIQSMGGSIPQYITYQQTKIIGDTTILTKNCMVMKKLNAQNICESMGREYEYLYKSGDTLYWYNPDMNGFTPLYIFSALVGESWDIAIGNCSFSVSVDSINTVIINNKTERVLYISDFDNYFSGEIIEDIGHTTSFFPKDIYWSCNGVGCDSDRINMLRCYLVNDTLQYHWSLAPCDTNYLFFTNMIEHSLANSINIYPNPVKDFFALQFKNEIAKFVDEFYYQIVDTQGRLVNEGYYTRATIFSSNNLSPCLYTLRLFLDSSLKININLKFLKL